MGWRWGWSGPYPGRGPWSHLPPPLRPGWIFGRGWCWYYLWPYWHHPYYAWTWWYWPRIWWPWWVSPPYPWSWWYYRLIPYYPYFPYIYAW
ncbi:MAG: hypothetical protein ABWW65_03715 [Thermoprotei archaeon]